MDGWLVVLILVSAATHAAWNAILRAVGGDAGVSWLAQVVGVLLASPWAVAGAYHRGIALSGVGVLLVTGVVQAVYLHLLGRAYERGDFSLTYPVARGGGVVVTALASWCVFGDALSWTGVAGISVVCAGATLLGLAAARGGVHTTRSLGYAAAVALTLGVGSTLDKIGVGLVDPALYVTGMFAIGAALAAPRMWGRERAAVRAAWRDRRLAVVTIGTLMLGSYGLALYAFQRGPLAYVVAFRESSVVFGAAIGWWFLAEPVGLRRLIGLGTILAGLLVIRIG